MARHRRRAATAVAPHADGYAAAEGALTISVSRGAGSPLALGIVRIERPTQAIAVLLPRRARSRSLPVVPDVRSFYLRPIEGSRTSPMGWGSLRLWGDDVVRVERLSGGVANDVWSVRYRGVLAVARLGTRSDADLAWEAALLQHLDREGLTVPLPIPTADGRRFADGLMVMTYVEGAPPSTGADWRRVAGTLRHLHRVTAGWPQRPGWRSSTDLLHTERGTRIDLTAMPPEAVARCRAAWARLAGRPASVVHGDPNPRNIRITAERVALIDWDESHVDVSELDLVLPGNAAGFTTADLDVAAQASAAWEAAVCWPDDHSAQQLAEVRPV